MPVLDLGCGRGEWLELLGDHDLCARGVDCNGVFLEQCRQRGLGVSAGDALEHLSGLPDRSVGAVTAFHLIEHLPFLTLLEFLDEVVRVLKPGGLALFETPNPENLLVGSCFFYIDPTHQHPLFGPTLQFLAEQRGLVRVAVRPMNQHLLAPLYGTDPDQLVAEVQGLPEILRRHLLAAPDYALIGWKA
jgi:O-antigen chain-terminating methyltransferase